MVFQNLFIALVSYFESSCVQRFRDSDGLKNLCQDSKREYEVLMAHSKAGNFNETQQIMSLYVNI